MRKKVPNIIFLILDCARAKSFSCYGYQRPTTPNIDRFAEESVLYSWCFSPSNWTIPSHASIFTGLYPWECGCDYQRPQLGSNFFTLPEVLRQQGYRTFGVTCNGLVSLVIGFGRGFDVFCDLWRFPIPKETHFGTGSDFREKARILLRMLMSKEVMGVFGKAVNAICRRILGSVLTNSTPWTLRAAKMASRLLSEGAKHKPFFLFVNFMQLHGNYNPPPVTRGLFGSRKGLSHDLLVRRLRETDMQEEERAVVFGLLRALYEEELLFLDRVVGNLLAQCRDTGLLDDSIVVITSDHGELLGEQGKVLGHGPGPWLCNALIHVPLIVRYPPGTTPTPMENENLVQLTDLYATLLEAAESAFPLPKSSFPLIGREERNYALAVGEDVNRKMWSRALILRRANDAYLWKVFWDHKSVSLYKIKNALVEELVDPGAEPGVENFLPSFAGVLREVLLKHGVGVPYVPEEVMRLHARLSGLLWAGE